MRKIQERISQELCTGLQQNFQDLFFFIRFLLTLYCHICMTVPLKFMLLTEYIAFSFSKEVDFFVYTHLKKTLRLFNQSTIKI